jgi:hypothetical protein
LPSARLFLQKGGNGPRTGGQHSFWARETKPFPEGYFFVASTEPPALLEKRNHLIHKGLKTLGINILLCRGLIGAKKGGRIATGGPLWAKKGGWAMAAAPARRSR